jgi:AcrR family transcriptional regulator
MDAGMAVLADHGPDGTTVGEVARRARVSPGTFYNHFDDRDALIGAVVDELAGGVEISGGQLRSVEHDAAARVVIGTRQLMALARDEPATARAFVTLLAAVPAFRTRVRAIVRSAIDDGIAQGRFEPRPSLVTTDALLGAVVQWMRTRLAGEADASAEAVHLELALGIAGLPRSEVDDVIAAAAA